MGKSIFRIPVLLTMCLVQSLSYAQSSGQFPDFNIETLTTSEDSVHLQDWLDDGKYVFIDFFGSFCNPCWNFLESGIYQDLWDLYGPDTDEDILRVAVLETTEDITDEFLLSEGWTDGVTFPMANVQDLVLEELLNSLIYTYPAHILVCPDGTWRLLEFLPPNMNAYYSQISEECPDPSAVDLILHSVTGTSQTCGTVETELTIFNQGYEFVEEVDLKVWQVTSPSTFVLQESSIPLQLAPGEGLTMPYLIEGVSPGYVILELDTLGDALPENNSNNHGYLQFDEAIVDIPVEFDLNDASELPWHFRSWTNVNQETYFDIHISENGTIPALIGPDGGVINSMYYDSQLILVPEEEIIWLGIYDFSSVIDEFVYLSMDRASPWDPDNPHSEQLELVGSLDCGVSWSSIWSVSGQELSTTVDASNTYYVQDEAEWSNSYIDLSTYIGEAEVTLGFRITSDLVGRTYLTDMDFLTSPSPLGLSDIAESPLKAYPNPASEIINIRAQDVSRIELYDALGRRVERVHQSWMDVSDLNEGVYLMQVFFTDGRSGFQKVLIEH